MPCIIIQSNAKIDADKQAVMLKELSKAIAKVMGKPESYVMVGFQHTALIFGGTDAPCAFCQLSSIGAISAEANAKYAKLITDLLEKFLVVEPSRVYITFADVKPYNWGYNGGTF